MKNSGWDIDFDFGVKGENMVANTLKYVEVKTDRRWKETGNIYIEVYCYYQKTQSWEPSGLSVTTSQHWAFNLEGTIIVVATDVLKYACSNFGKKISCAIPPNPSRGYLITVDDLLKSTKWQAAPQSSPLQ